MNNFLHELQENLTSEVRSDTIYKQLYSVDASIYEVEPLAIVIPRSKSDLIKAMQIAAKHKVSVIPRGAATGITGGCLGKGLIIDTSMHLNKIISIDYENECVICEPGVVQDELNAVLGSQGYRLGPDTSTGNRATIGGMIGNNAAGAHALQFGQMVDHTEEIELILYGGEVIQCKKLSKEELQKKRTLSTREGDIYRTIATIQEEYAAEISMRFPKVPRRVSGYNLNELIKPSFCNLSKLITGAEGSLGFISQVTLKICKKPLYTAIVVIAANDMLEGLQFTERYLQFHPFALELIDKKIIEAGRASPAMHGKLAWLDGNPDALFVVEFTATQQKELEDKCNAFSKQVCQEPYIAWMKTIYDTHTQECVWNLRKSGLGLLLSKRSYDRAIAFIEDLAIPPNKISHFLHTFTAYLKSQGKEAGIYGHIGDGCLHIRPYINLMLKSDRELMHTIMLDVAKMVQDVGGALSAEHGDGLIRSWTNPLLFGEKLYQAFVMLKRAFDPDGLMNPGKVVAESGLGAKLGDSLLENLRLTPQTPITHLKTFFNFDREGGIELAVDLCNGNGQCRKKEGLMCPSFQVTDDEKDTTRARANSFRALIHGKISPNSMQKKEFYEVMDLCIQCKGCKTECPSQVDMAKMKAEYLYQYHKKEGFPLKSYLFGHIGTLFCIGAYIPRISNFLLQTAFAKKLFNSLGIAPQRDFPKLAEKRFSKSYKNPEIRDKKIVLFSDTFTEFTAPEIGFQAAKVLEKLGFQILVPQWSCCGRTLISKGLLKEAKKKAEHLINVLYPYAAQGITICGLEPSCILTIRDEFRDLHLDRKKVDCVIQMTKTIDEVLADHIPQLAAHLKEYSGPIFVHGHCHQKALVGMHPTLTVLRCIQGASVHEIPSGCCGMAGSFGYEKEHYEFSLKIGELVLFPEIRKHNPTTIIASGTSCRCQIKDGTGKRALHLVEFLAQLF